MQKDKIKHIGAGFLVSLFISLLVANSCALVFPAWLSGFLGALACGGGKEWADKAWGGTFDLYDLGATALGGLLGGIGSLVSLLI